MSMLAYKILDLVADIWLCAKFYCGEVTDTISDDLFCWILVIQIVFSFNVWTLSRLRR